MAAAQDRDGKKEALRKQGALNPKPEQVTDPLFQQDPFFDPRDLVQVKYNAAPGGTGWPYGQPGMLDLWFITPIVLPSAGDVPTRRAPGLGQKKAGAAKPTQTDPRGAGICPPGATTGSSTALEYAGREGEEALRCQPSSPHPRTGGWRIEKKTASSEVKIERSQTLTELYEALRNDGCGYGRALLMAHGITAWMQAWSQWAAVGEGCTGPSSDTKPNHTERCMSERVVPESAQSELVRVMAAMAWAVGRGVRL